MNKFVTFFAIGVLLSISPQAFAGGYVSNALSVTVHEGSELFSNRDVQCVSLFQDEGKPSVRFVLNEYASRNLRDYTAKNIGKTMGVSICGQPGKNSKIMAPISSGYVGYSGLTELQLDCLKNSFEVNTKCSDCPVCKN